MTLEERKEPALIVLAEDNRADVTLVRQALMLHELACELHVVEDGELAVGVFDRVDADEGARCPDLLLLDLNLPKVNGEEVLEHLQESTRCARIPVIVITSSDSAKDRAMAQRLGAAKYFRKPSDLGEFMCLGALIKGVLSGERVKREG